MIYIYKAPSTFLIIIIFLCVQIALSKQNNVLNAWRLRLHYNYIAPHNNGSERKCTFN